MRRISSAAYVTAVLRFLQAYNAGDFDALEELLVADVEWDGVVSHNGRAEARAYLEALHGRWDEPHARPEDFREADGRVLMVVAFTGKSAHTNRTLEERHSWICELTDDGKLRRVVAYSGPAEAALALERAGTHA